MLDNYKYDLAHQLTQESKSLWRIKNEYLKNAEGHPSITEFWSKMQKDKENHIKELKKLVKEEL